MILPNFSKMSINSVIQYFIPKHKKIFFPLFEQAANNVVIMASALVELVNSNNPADREELFKQIDKLENKGDEITHRIHLELGKNFVIPFDREDIHSLASAIDDVADDAEKDFRLRKYARTHEEERGFESENRADYIFDRAVADLFLYETDAIRLIKYKEILSSLETATDMCEDAANVMETILVKNA